MGSASNAGWQLAESTNLFRLAGRLAYNTLSMNMHGIYRHAPNCLMEDMDGELLIYNPDTTTTLHLNGPSAVVWHLLTGEHSVAYIISGLQEMYPDQSDQIEPDVTHTVKDMLAQKVIVEVETS